MTYIAESYFSGKEGDINIDDVVLQSKERDIFLFTDGSSLNIKNIDNQVVTKPNLDIEIFLEDENQLNPPKLCIVSNQHIKTKKGDEFISSVLYLDSDLNGAVSFKNENNENESRKISQQESIEKLALMNIDHNDVINGLKNYNEIQKVVKEKYKKFMDSVKPEQNDSNKPKRRRVRPR